jgi:hypothetical protein
VALVILVILVGICKAGNCRAVCVAEVEFCCTKEGDAGIMAADIQLAP